MADLDDFFAKKDKKKTKKPKFLTAEELVKNLEESSKKETPLKNVRRNEMNNGASTNSSLITVNQTSTALTETPNSGVNSVVGASSRLEPSALEPTSTSVTSPVTSTSTVATTSSTTGDQQDISSSKYMEDENLDEEWNEYEVEQRKDYSGLKIGQFTINEENLSSYQGNREGADGEGSTLNNPDGQSPWKKVTAKDEEAEAAAAAQATEPVKPVGVYRPPIQRFQSKTRLKTAPDLKNEEFFPTLDAARPEEQRKKKSEPAFEEVRPGQGARWKPRSMRDYQSNSSSAYNHSSSNSGSSSYNRNSSSASESMRSNTNRFRSLEETNS